METFRVGDCFTIPSYAMYWGDNIYKIQNIWIEKTDSLDFKAIIYSISQKKWGDSVETALFKNMMELVPCPPAACGTGWQCEPGQTGWEIDGCGNRRTNPACNPPQIGNIRFVSIPPGAEIFIDGADQGVKTPNTITNVPVGSHTYAMKLAGYNDYTGTVQVQAGQTAQVSATLTPIVPSCTPSWVCEPGQTGWEIDGCGNTRPSSACAVVPPAVRPSRAGLYLAVGTTAFIGAVGFVALTREK